MQFSKLAAILALFAVGAVAIPNGRGGDGDRRGGSSGGNNNDNSHNNDNSQNQDNSKHQNTNNQECSGGKVVCKRGEYFFLMKRTLPTGDNSQDNSDNCSDGDTYCCAQAGDGANYCSQGAVPVTLAPSVEVLRMKV